MLKNCTIYSWIRVIDMKNTIKLADFEAIQLYANEDIDCNALCNEVIPAYELVFHDAYYDFEVDYEVLMAYEYMLVELYCVDDFFCTRVLWE